MLKDKDEGCGKLLNVLDLMMKERGENPEKGNFTDLTEQSK